MVGLGESLSHTGQPEVRTRVGRQTQSPPCHSWVPPSSHCTFLGTCPQPCLPALQVSYPGGQLLPRQAPITQLFSYCELPASSRDFHQTMRSLFSSHSHHGKERNVRISSRCKLWMTRNLETRSLFLRNSSFKP